MGEGCVGKEGQLGVPWFDMCREIKDEDTLNSGFGRREDDEGATAERWKP